jgi:hypothetical protein
VAAVAVELRLLLLLFRLAEDVRFFRLEGLETRETDVGVLDDDEAEPFTAQRANLSRAEKPVFSSLTGHR